VLFLSFDLPFFGANLMKFLDGGYVPILVGTAFFTIMLIWKLGRRTLRAYTLSRATPIDTFLATVDERVVMRVPGTAVFLTSHPSDVPLILELHIRRIRVLHAHVVLLTMEPADAPHLRDDERFTIDDLGHGFTRIVIRCGFMEEPNVPRLLHEAIQRFSLSCDLEDATFYLGRETFLATARGRLGPLREGLFGFLSRNAASSMTYFGIPPEQVIEIGAQIDL
jgi:KUP system potassium uptake protein